MRILVLLLFLAGSTYSRAANLPPGFIEIPLATGLDPTGMAQAPDGRIFILEKYGAVRIVENDVLLPDPFIQLAVDNFNERGLSGIAFDPQFALNGYVYLYYTVKSAGHNRLSRVQAIGNYAVPGSEEVLLELDPLIGTVHNAGAMAFGADGKLYLGTGESSDAKKAPDLHSLLGKILRLNSDGTIPADNPFYNQTTGIYRAIYAVGFRNPFSLSIQPGTNRVLIGDVGNDQFEEINQIEAGMHYGWNLLEGKRSTQTVPANYRDPLYTYPHSVGCAVVGLTFYNPPVAQFPANYVGKVFFGDYCKNHLKVLNPETGEIEGTFATGIDRPLVLLAGLKGELYYISRGGIGGGTENDNTSSGEGVLWRVEYVGDGAPVFSGQPQNTLVPAGEEAVFSANANGTPPIAYQWQRDGVDLPGATGKTLSLPALTLADSGALLRCLASNTFGQVLSKDAVLGVTSNQRPEPVISSPGANYLYAAGDTVRFSGQAFDPETGLLSENALSWRIDLHHEQHTHPGTGTIADTNSGTYIVPRVGETSDQVWLRLYLTARDPLGLSRTVYRDIFPQKTRLRLESDPPGLAIRVDSKTQLTPFEVVSVKGLSHQIQAPPSFPGRDTITVFSRWENGSELPDTVVFADAA
ncbi:MAG: PQQ-dependent sugar dehydrogenase, partial [Saprospiraceae bacterium]|nr:PQQ-dependent sugar dehydrogenase [Saprospiraceae bacterium]